MYFSTLPETKMLDISGKVELLLLFRLYRIFNTFALRRDKGIRDAYRNRFRITINKQIQ